MLRIQGLVSRQMAGGLLALSFALVLAGCASVSPGLRAQTDTPVPSDAAAEAHRETPPTAGATQPTLLASAMLLASDAGPVMLAQAGSDLDKGAPEEVEQYDPWEPFNEKMFDFNLKLDKWVLKPVARAYRWVLPEEIQVVVRNAFDNIAFVPRAVNSALQGKFGGAGREVLRFVLNSTMGFGGLFDPAKDYVGIPPSKEDFGQTLGVWGSGPGPYLILPGLGPMTVRDGIGKGVDGAMDPMSYFVPFFWERLVLTAGEKVNERALNYELFEGVEETTLDLYSSVRHYYLNRRQLVIKE